MYVYLTTCNGLYKIISKVISSKIKRVLNEYISSKHFGFITFKNIHEAIEVAQEGLDSMKCKRMKDVVIKNDLSKAYDRLTWVFLRITLSQMGFVVPFISWIMGCLVVYPSLSLSMGQRMISFIQAYVLGKVSLSLLPYF